MYSIFHNPTNITIGLDGSGCWPTHIIPKSLTVRAMNTNHDKTQKGRGEKERRETDGGREREILT